MRSMVGGLAVLFVITAAASAQDQPPVTTEQQLAAAVERLQEPQTAIEKWQEHIGALVTSRYDPVGRLPGRFDLDLAVSACTVTMQGDDDVLRGVVVDAQNRYAIRAARVFIDAHEAPALLEALTAIATTRQEGGYDDFDARYRTAGGLVVRVYSSSSGQGGVAASVEIRERGRLHGPIVDLPVDQLSRLRGLIEQAMAVGQQ